MRVSGPLCCVFLPVLTFLKNPLPAVPVPEAAGPQWEPALSVVVRKMSPSQCATHNGLGVASIPGLWHSCGFRDQERQQNSALALKMPQAGMSIQHFSDCVSPLLTDGSSL